MRRVEDPGNVALAQVDDPLAEIPHIDELRLPFARSRGERLTSARETAGPVCEAAGRIMRTDDQARPDDERPLVEGLTTASSHSAFKGP